MDTATQTTTVEQSFHTNIDFALNAAIAIVGVLGLIRLFPV